jgi:CRP-like cAMP-binding protein
VEIRDDQTNNAIVRIAACNSLMDRGYGRPLQGVAFKDLTPLPDPKQITSTMTHAEAADMYARTIKQAERDLSDLVEGPERSVIDVPENGES